MLNLDRYDTEVALWPRIIMGRLKQVERVGLDAALKEATPAEVLDYMESVTRYNPADGIMVGVFAHAMYLMLTELGYPQDRLPDTIAKGAVLSEDAAQMYQQITTAIREAQIAHQQDVPPTATWVAGAEVNAAMTF